MLTARLSGATARRMMATSFQLGAEYVPMQRSEMHDRTKVPSAPTSSVSALGLYRVAGTSGIAIAIAYLVIIGLYVHTGAPPDPVVQRLESLAAHRSSWWSILALSVATDLLFAPLAFGLYELLEAESVSLLRFAVLCVGLFIVLDLSVTWTNYAALIDLGVRYAHAGSDAQRTILSTAAQYPATVLSSGVLFVYNSLSLALGILAFSAAMRGRAGWKLSAYLGIATGLSGVVSVVGSFFIGSLARVIVLTSALSTVWTFLVGWRLVMLSGARGKLPQTTI